MFYIKTENIFDGNSSVENGVYMSIKKDLNLHGYGLKSVKRIVNTYDGKFKIDKTDDAFTVSI